MGASEERRKEGRKEAQSHSIVADDGGREDDVKKRSSRASRLPRSRSRLSRRATGPRFQRRCKIAPSLSVSEWKELPSAASPRPSVGLTDCHATDVLHSPIWLAPPSDRARPASRAAADDRSLYLHFSRSSSDGEAAHARADRRKVNCVFCVVERLPSFLASARARPLSLSGSESGGRAGGRAAGRSSG